MVLRHLAGKLRIAAANLRQAAAVPRSRPISRSYKVEKSSLASKDQFEEAGCDHELLRELKKLERYINRLPVVITLSMAGGVGLAFGLFGCVVAFGAKD